MKILISADIEGINGLYKKSELRRKDKETYYESCKLMTREVNFVVSLLENHEIYVIDGHGKGNNLIKEELDSSINLLTRDSTKAMLTGIENCDGMILLGYHEMAGKETFCSHTNSTPLIGQLKVNNDEIGETGSAFMMASQFNVPIIAIIGTDGVLNEIDDSKVSFAKACDSINRLECIPINRNDFEVDCKKKILFGFNNMFYPEKNSNILKFEIHWKKNVNSFNDSNIFWKEKNYCSFQTNTFEEGYKIYRSLLDYAVKNPLE